jgi:N-acetylglucosamine kinase-like BadF-type ATPase
MGCVLGVDAGGTKTIAVVADVTGQVQGYGKSGPANFQDCGVVRAAEEIRLAVQAAAGQAGVDPSCFQAVCYGVSGADRPKDFKTVMGITHPLTPCPIFRLENDTIIALRAGTPDGVGIAVVAGTGSNTIGRTARGEKLQVGGLGRLSGDFGSAGQLAEAAIVASIMGQDGRSPYTMLTNKITTHLGIEKIEDIIEFFFHDADRSALPVGSLAPLVFETASEGDKVAQSILREAGSKLGDALRVIIDRLFAHEEDLTVVFGGSIFQRATNLTLFEALVRSCREHRPKTRFVRLQVEPVLGAVAFAFDDAGWDLTVERWERLKESFRAPSARPEAGE